MELTQELVKELFDYKDGNLYWKKINVKNQIKIGDKAGYLDTSGYYRTEINNKLYLNHRLIYLYYYGYLLKQIDHIDNNSLNNKIENLRETNQSENMMNQSKQKRNTSSKYKGVTWDKNANKWRARVGINKKLKNLGLFKSEIDAVLAYNNAEIKYFGEYAYLNEDIK